MGYFDDLIPKQVAAPQATSRSGLFDDLIPDQQSASGGGGAGLFDDLIPAQAAGEQSQPRAKTWGETLSEIPTIVRAGYAKMLAGAMLDPLEQAAQAEALGMNPESLAGQRELQRLEPLQAHMRRMGEGARVDALFGNPSNEAVDRERGVIAAANEDLQALASRSEATFGQRAVQTAANSLATSIPALLAGLVTKSPALAAATMLPTTEAQSYADLRDDGVLPGAARKHAFVQGGLEAGTEALPFHALLKPGSSFYKRALEFLVSEMPGESIATLTQTLDDHIARLPADVTVQDVADGLKAGAAQLPETWAATLLAGGAQAGVAHVADRAVTRAAKKRDQRNLGAMLQELNTLDAPAAPEVSMPAAPAVPAAPVSTPTPASGSELVGPTAAATAAPASTPAAPLPTALAEVRAAVGGQAAPTAEVPAAVLADDLPAANTALTAAPDTTSAVSGAPVADAMAPPPLRSISQAVAEAPARIRNLAGTVHSFVQKVVDDTTNSHSRLEIVSQVSEDKRAKILAATGVDVGTSREQIDSSTVRHVRTNHPEVTEQDWEVLPWLMENFEEVSLVKAEPGDQGKRMAFTATDPTTGYVYVAEVLSGAKRGDRLTIKTFFKGHPNSVRSYLRTNGIPASEQQQRLTSDDRLPDGQLSHVRNASEGSSTTAQAPVGQAPAQPLPAAAPAGESIPAAPAQVNQENPNAPANPERTTENPAGSREASAASATPGAQQPAGPGAVSEAAGGRRKAKGQKGPLSAHARRPVGRSFYTRVFEDAGHNADEAELMSADKQFDIVATQLQQRYGFRSVTKEPSHTYREALDALLDAYQNLQSMVAALDLPLRAASLNGTLDLQLTKGGDGALAWHMGLPNGSRISVSRRNHAFGHEWLHGLDHHLLLRSGARNVDLITGRLFTGKLRRGLDVSRTEPNLVEAMGNVLQAMYKDAAAKAAHIRTLELRLEKEKDAKAMAVIKKQLAAVRRNQPPESSYYRGAVSLDKGRYQTPEGGSDKGYWQRPTEMWARAGEAYMARNIERMGGGTQFVAQPDAVYTQQGVEFFEKAYPNKADRERIFAAMDELFGVVSNLQMFGTEKAPAANTDNVTFDNMDPRLWQASATADPWAALPYHKRLVAQLGALVKDAASATRREAQALGAQWQNTKAGLDEPLLRYMERLLASSLYSGRGTLLFLKKVYPHSQAVDELLRKLVTRPGTGEFTGRTYDEAVGLYAKQKGNIFLRLVRKHGLEGLDEKELRALRDLMAGVRTTGPHHLLTAAKDLGFFLDQMWYDLKQAGIDIGYTKENYLPRIYDHAAIERNPTAFLRAAENVYALMNVEDPQKAAREWLGRIHVGRINDFDKNGIASSFTKGRALPAEADALLADFMIRDPLELIQTYIMQASRRIAWADRFGANNSGLDRILHQLEADGLRGEDIQLAKSVIETATGRRQSRMPKAFASAASWIHTVGVITLLPRAPLSSLAEPVTAAVRSGDVRDAARALGGTVVSLLRTANGRELREFAEFLGLIGDTVTDQLLMNRIGGDFTDSKTQARLLSAFFKRTGLHGLTNAQRAGIIPLTDAYLRSWAQRLLENKASALGVFAELGIPATQAQAFSRWLLDLDHRPTIEDLEAAPPDMRELYTTALYRFNYESIQDVKPLDKAVLAHNPIGRLVFSVAGFQWAFQRNVLLRMGHMGKAALTGRYGGHQLTPQERMTSFSLGLIPPLATLYVAQLMVSIGREALLNPDRWEDWGDDFLDRALSEESLMLGLSRSGVLGAYDPVFNGLTGMKYQRDLANLMVGAVPGYYLQAVQRMAQTFVRNSPKTNTAEFNQLKGLYQLAVAPAINVSLSWAPGAPLLAPLYGGAMMALTSPNAANEFAEAIVGEKGTKTKD